MNEITLNSKIVSNGGSLDYISQDGELLGSTPIAPGIHNPYQYLMLCPDGAHIELNGEIFALNPKTRARPNKYGDGSHRSGANPDFRPTSASRHEMEMRLTLNKMKAATDRIEARARALETIERVPRPDDVLEVIPAPKPAPEPAPEPAPVKEPVNKA